MGSVRRERSPVVKLDDKEPLTPNRDATWDSDLAPRRDHDGAAL